MAVTEARPAARLQTAPTGTVSVVSLAGMEARAGFRSAAFRLAAALAIILGLSVGSAGGQGAAMSAWATGEAAWKYFGFVVIVWMSLVAVHDTVSRTDVVVYSKPQPTERLVLSRFMAAYLQLIAALALMYVGAAVSRLAAGGGLTGFSAYPIRFAVSAEVAFFTAAASYSLALLARTPLAGVVVGLLWILTLAGKTFVPKAAFPAYTQNMAIYVPLGFALVCIACAGFRRQRRGGAPAAGWAKLGSLLGLALAILGARHVVLTGYDPQIRTQVALDEMAEQNATLNKIAPGFRLPDQAGKLTSLTDFEGKVIVLALFSPNEPDSTLTLTKMDEVQRRFGNRGVQVVAVCMSEDDGAAFAFARGEGVHFPVVQDWGTHTAEKPDERAPIANAYQVSSLPLVIITDRSRVMREGIIGPDTYEGDHIDLSVEQRLKQEPE